MSTPAPRRRVPLRSPSFATMAAIAALLPAAALGQTLTVHGGGLGQTLTLDLDFAPPANTGNYLLLMSLTTGPTALPAPHLPSIDVGFDLLDLSISLPGFIGSTAAPVSLPLPVPNAPVLDGLNVNFQALRFAPSGTIEHKTNLYRVTFDTPGQFSPALGSLGVARAFPTANRLQDGRVLVAGGGQGSITSATGLASSELYLPNLEAAVPGPTMNSARALHRSVALPDGRVLLVGGVDGNGVPLATTEIYDPQTNLFVPAPNLAVPRVGHTATLLPGNKVLVAGGSSNLTDAIAFITSAQSSTEILDLAGGGFVPGPSLNQPKTFHEATALPNGNVLVSGGLTFTVFIVPIPAFSDRAQVYVAATNTMSGTIGMTARAAHGSLRLADGRVLLVGGANGSVLSPTLLSSATLFNPATNSFAAAASLAAPLAVPSLALLPDGRVLVAGGAQGDLTNPVPVNVCQLYTPAAGGPGSFGPTFGMSSSRSGHPFVVLADGTAACFGGAGGPANGSLASIDVFQP